MSRLMLSSRIWSLIFMLALALSTSAAERTPFQWQTNYEQAQRSRIESQKPMVVYLTMDGCPHCHRMLKTSYRNRQVAGQISNDYVATIINASRQEELAKQFGVRIYPTTFLVGPDNRIVDKMEGYVEANELQRRLTIVSRYYAQLARMKGSLSR